MLLRRFLPHHSCCNSSNKIVATVTDICITSNYHCTSLLAHSRRRFSRMSATPAASAASASPFTITATSPSTSSSSSPSLSSVARAGILHTRTQTFPTPNAFFYTFKGNPPHLTADMIQHVPLMRGLHLPIAEFMNTPGEQLIRAKFPQNRLHDYVHLSSQHITYMSCRDPLIDGVASANENGVSLIGTQGTSRLTPQQYATLIHAYQPDIVSSISDEISSSVHTNRAKKSSQRSVMWTDEMMKVWAEKDAIEAAAANTASAATLKRPLFFASIQGGGDLEQRHTSCYQYSLRDDIYQRQQRGETVPKTTPSIPAVKLDGFVFSGLGSGEDAAKRTEIIRAMASSLPTTKPRMLSASSSLTGAPEHILDMIGEGIDLFEVAWTHQLTLLGQATVFRFREEDVANAPAADTLPVTKLHLRDSIYARDGRPILEGCKCYTCRHHTRSYLHHLLNVHEMLAPILLDLHNIWHYTEFLETVRQQIGKGRFAQYKNEFRSHYFPSASIVPLSSSPLHANQVGRALLGPFSPLLHVSACGTYGIRRLLPKDNAQVGAIIKEVMTSFGCVGEGYAIGDSEVQDMYTAYETTPIVKADTNEMADVPAAASATPAPIRSAYFVIVRTDNDSIVLGGGGIGLLAGSSPTTAELRKMYLLPAVRRLGLGEAIVQLCIQQAKKSEFKEIYLETIQKMTNAQAMYEKNGWKRIDKPIGSTGHFNCDVRMLKEL